MSGKYESSIKIEQELRLPKMYTVIMHNDDYTTMEFVVEVLTRVFHKNETEANQIMLAIHNIGNAAVGVYTYDIAVTKKNQSDLIASEKGFPLRLTVEENAV